MALSSTQDALQGEKDTCLRLLLFLGRRLARGLCGFTVPPLTSLHLALPLEVLWRGLRLEGNTRVLLAPRLHHLHLFCK